LHDLQQGREGEDGEFGGHLVATDDVKSSVA
jgi:hypothetical protein